MDSLLEDYIESHISPEPEYLTAIDRNTNIYRLNGRMCSGHIQGQILKMLTRMVGPKKALELGTFTGYSALCIAEGLSADATLHTIEADEELEEIIRSNLKGSPFGDKVKLHIGDARHIIREFPEEYFDMALVDADKRQYCEYLRELFPKMKTGGFILADNTLWDGHVTELGKHSSQTEGILRFNDAVARSEAFETAILPVRDGLTILRKTGKALELSVEISEKGENVCQG